MSAEEYWKQDKLGRKGDAEFLIKFLLNRVEERGEMGKSKSYVLNIDAQWGDGKTFFLKGLEAQLSEDGYPVAYVNAWADDHAEDPMIAVVSAIDGAISPLLSSNKKLRTDWGKVRKSASNIARSVGKGLAKQGAKLLIGASVELVEQEIIEIKDELSDATETLTSATGDAIDGFFEERDEISTFRETLTSILEALSRRKSQKLPLFVLIDELDRCRPPYAIAMLERVKHLFDIDEVVFVIATDSEQLQHAIRSVYGAGFASERYLARFFDRTFRFRAPTHLAFLTVLFEQYKLPLDLLSSPPDDDHVQFFAKVASEYGLALRDIEQCFDMLRSIVTVWRWRTQVELAVLLPLIVYWQQKRENYLNVFSDEAVRRDLANDYHHSRQPILFLRHDRMGATQKSSCDVTNLFLKLVADTSRTFEQNEETSSSGDPQISWRRRVFRAELNATLQEDGVGYESKSILRYYPELVRSVGRLENDNISA